MQISRKYLNVSNNFRVQLTYHLNDVDPKTVGRYIKFIKISLRIKINLRNCSATILSEFNICI